MIFKKILFATAFLLWAFSFFVPPIYAVTKISGDLEVTFDEPIFPSSVIWYPGFTYTNSFSVKNNDTQSRTVAINATNTSQTDTIAEVYTIEVSENGVNRYGGNSTTMQNFWDAGEISLSSLAAGDTTTYNMTVSMQSSAGNETQNQTAIFDMIIGFLGTDEAVTVLGTNTSTSGDGGGTSSTNSVCTDTAPSSAPILLSAIAGTNSVTLNWTTAGDPVSYYLIAYGTSSGQYLYGADVGMTTSYTVNNLSGGTTYYFIVRAGNGCSPGPFSNELASTPGGIVVSGIAEGFAEGVLGEATQSAEIEEQTVVNGEQTGEIQGEEDEICVNSWWWWVVMVVYGIYNMLFLTIGKKIKRVIKFVLYGITSMIAIVFLMNALCNWWLAIFITILIGVIEFFLFKAYLK